MKTIQYGWRGEWLNMGGHGCGTVEEMEASVARQNAREGYERMRVADESTEGEMGAPPKPIREVVPMPQETFGVFLELVRRSEDGTATEDDRARMREIMDATRGPIIGYEQPRPPRKAAVHPETP